MDADQAGQIATENFSKKLGEKKTLIINTRKHDPNGPKDANDALREGKDFQEYIRQAKPLSGDNIIKMSDIKSEIIQFLSQYESYSGYKSTSFSFFNKKLKGLRMGEFSIFTGETGSGKTTFLSQLSLDFITQRVPTLWGSFEIKNDKLASLFLMQSARKNLRLAPIPEIEFHSENFEKLPLYMLKFHGSQNIDEVINSMNFAVYNYDIQNIVLDNLQFMIGAPSKMTNKFDFQDEIIHRLRKFATEKNVHVTLVIHPRKDDILKISSIFGTGKASQEADNIYILQSYKGLRILEIAKNRFDGTTGKVALAFDNNSCRFFELNLDEFSRIVKDNVKLEDIVKERFEKFGAIEEKIENENERENFIPNEKENVVEKSENIQSSQSISKASQSISSEDSPLLDSFVLQKEKEMNQFNKETKISKERIFENDNELLGEGNVINSFSNNHKKGDYKGKERYNQNDYFVSENNKTNKEKDNDTVSNIVNWKQNDNVKKENYNNIKLDNDIINKDEDVEINEKVINELKEINQDEKEEIFNKENVNRINVANKLEEVKVNLTSNEESIVKEDNTHTHINKSEKMENKAIFTENFSINNSLEPKDLNTLSDISSFQTKIFPKITVIDTFHTHESQEKTQSNNQSYNKKPVGVFNKNDQRVRQSTYKVPREAMLDDFF
jgi:twinkle protein